MRSMTGYGAGEVQTESFILSVEIKSYNSRFLEIIHTMPSAFACFESDIDNAIKGVAVRGHVEVNVKYKALRSNVRITVDQGALEQYSGALDQIESSLGRAATFSFSDLAQVENLITATESFDPQEFRPSLMTAVNQALSVFSESKQREGEVTKADLLRLLDGLDEGFSVVKSNASQLESVIKESLMARFNEMLGDKGYDEGRFLQEVAVLLVKYSINEEICRLSAHIDEARKLINGETPCGKRLDFLCQEMNREINTIGSKNVMVDISQKVVAMKDSLENIREQIRNIE